MIADPSQKDHSLEKNQAAQNCVLIPKIDSHVQVGGSLFMEAKDGRESHLQLASHPCGLHLCLA
jgi:hypothetical protein